MGPWWWTPWYSLHFLSLTQHTCRCSAAPRLGSNCTPLVSPEAYSLIRPHESLADSHHGYKKISACGQVFYSHVAPSQGANLALSGDEEGERRRLYRDKLLKDYGSGFLDFSSPDDVHFNAELGVTSFPLEGRCGGDANRSNASEFASQIYLSSMITTKGFRPMLLKHFVRYYSDMGIQSWNMLFTVQIDSFADRPSIEPLISILVGFGVYYDVYVGKWTSQALMFHQMHKLGSCTKFHDWILVADSDEFHEYPAPSVQAFLADCEKRGVNIINGIFKDRIASRGRLQPLKGDRSIFRQYPLSCELHRLFALGTPKKTMAFKGYLRINRGHHRVAPCTFWLDRGFLHMTPWKHLGCPPASPYDLLNPYPKRLNVFHFKWMAGQYEATKHKAEVWKNHSVGAGYNSVLDHFEKHGRKICIHCGGTRCHFSPKPLIGRGR